MSSSASLIDININILAAAEAAAISSSLSQELHSSAKQMLSTSASNSQAYLVQEKLSLQTDLARQQEDEVMGSPTHVCEWMPTSILLSANGTNAGKGTHLCLPVHLSEASYFKQNEEKEECKDDGYCTATASQLRMMQLDRYLAAVAPIASSTRRLLFGGMQAEKNTNNHIMAYPGSINATPLPGKPTKRRTKYERQYQMKHASRTNPPQHRLITSTNSGRVINVIQGEIAHCTPTQADTLVSDDATTCHIVALWSRSSSSEGMENTVLATMTHIDGPGYEASIRDAVNEHVRYHSMNTKNTRANGLEECKESCSYLANADRDAIDMSIHIMGGFNDDEGSSIAITDSVLNTFATLSNEYGLCAALRGLPRIRMTLETCAVASANDDGNCCPLGRGLAMEVATGKVFLAEVEEVGKNQASLPTSPSTVTATSNRVGMVAVDGAIQLFNTVPNKSQFTSALGPAVTLRSVRLWASAFHPRSRTHESKLHVIHRPDVDYLCIDPFFFAPHFSAKSLLDCGDWELLSLTSTSPEVEKPNFVANVRASLSFMNGTNRMKVFPFGLPMKFQRAGLNGWVQMS